MESDDWTAIAAVVISAGALVVSVVSYLYARKGLVRQEQRELRREIRSTILDIRRHLQARGGLEDDHQAWLNLEKLRDDTPALHDEKLKEALEEFLPKAIEHEQALQDMRSLHDDLRQARGEVGLDPTTRIPLPKSRLRLTSPTLNAALMRLLPSC